MDTGVILQLAHDNPRMADVEQLIHIYHLLSQVLVYNVPGEVVELGCNEGKTSVFLSMIINYFAPSRQLHVYDSFQGLPDRSPQDEVTDDTLMQIVQQKYTANAGNWGLPPQYDKYLDKGDFSATVEQLEANFSRWKLPCPNVHAGWFDTTLPMALPEQIAFAYVDCDLYASVKTVLQHVYPRLSTRAIVVLDDYCDRGRSPQSWPGLPGVKRACDEFFAGKPETVFNLVGTTDLAMGYFRKLG